MTDQEMRISGESRRRGGVFRVIHILRAPIILLLISYAAFAHVDQVIEYYRAVSQDYLRREGASQSVNLNEIATILASLLLLSVGFFLVSQHLLLRHLPNPPGRTGVSILAITLVPPIFGAAPFLFVYLGLVNAQVAISDGFRDTLQAYFARAFRTIAESPLLANVLAKEWTERAVSFNNYLELGAQSMLGAAAALAVLYLIIGRRIRAGHDSGRASIGERLAAFAVYLALAGAVAAIVLNPIALPQITGAFALLCFFLICALVLFSKLSSWSDSTATPWLSLVLILLLAFSAFNLNDNHRIRTLDAANGTQSDPIALARPNSHQMTLSQALDAWWRSRRDRATFEQAGKRYPLYIVSAQGGGAYAGLHAASFLGGLQDFCPAFRHHLFAISGVSGGGVGASVFTSLAWLADQTPESRLSSGALAQGCAPVEGGFFASMSEEFFARDLLSPLIGGALFPDFLQRFLPVPIAEFDRARALENALEHSWEAVIRSRSALAADQTNALNPFAEPFNLTWSPAGDAPALLLNMTDVNAGRRRVITPFSFGAPDLALFPGALASRTRLSTATALSARFPWITPTGWYETRNEDGETDQIRLVDGGCIDNSGAATAIDLINDIRAAAAQAGLGAKLDVKLILLAGADVEPTGQPSFDEFATPIRALLNSHQVRSEIAVRRALRALHETGDRATGMRTGALLVRLASADYPLPLGWRLSEMTRNLIRAQEGDHRRCEGGSSQSGDAAGPNCVRAMLFEDLNHP